MQVNNNMSAQNFGMALKIKPEAMPALKNASIETLEKLGKIGEELKDTKHYHLEIGENMRPRITSHFANKYLPPFDPKQPNVLTPEFLSVHTTWDGTEIYGLSKNKPYQHIIQYESKEAALDAYKRISEQKSDLDRAAVFTKELDKRQIQKDEENARERAAKAAVENTANNLFAKFGTPAEESL